MAKVQHISGITKRIPFEGFDFYDLFRITFENSELGRMKRLLPLHEMALNFGLVSNRPERKRGPKPFFSPEGKVALMFLWECCEKAYSIMCIVCQRLEIHRPRTKYLDVEKANMGYVKQRKHSKSQQRKLTRRLIHLLGKILEEIRKMVREHDDEEVLTVREKSTMDIITKVYRQQKNHFNSNDPRESIPDRIVSISKPYVRPIVRGKEVKNVEFGAKCNNILVDGISFIEKLSFNAFSEGTRLEHCIKMHKRLFKVDAKKIGGDTGYAGTANRDLCRKLDIQTSFVKRGRPSAEKKEKDFVRQELARVRATAMEGSFGTQKEHYAMRRIKARKKKTEILYIFFGIHTANLVHLAERLAEQEQAKAA